MARLSLWGGPRKQNDYKFIDRTLSGFFYASGTACYVHLLLGAYPQTSATPAPQTTAIPTSSGTGTATAPDISGATANQNPADGSLYLYAKDMIDPAGAATFNPNLLMSGQKNPNSIPLNAPFPDPDWQFITGGTTPQGITLPTGPAATTAITGTGPTGAAASTAAATPAAPTLNPTTASSSSSTSGIQDILLLENRDQQFSSNVYEIRVTTNPQDNDFDLSLLGIQFAGDTIFLETHFNDMVAMCGRRLLAGDVIELPFMRDDSNAYDPNSPAINKFFVVADAYRAADGYGATWLPHIWRLKLTAMTDSQEYQNLLNTNATDPFGLSTGTTLASVMSTLPTSLQLSDDLVAQAAATVSKRNFETRQYYVVPGTELGNSYPWVFAGDAEPPNGAIPVGSGNLFPQNPSKDDYYVRIDYQPNTLFKFTGTSWQIQECDYRQSQWWSASRLLEDFINNNNITTLNNGDIFAEKQPLWQAVRPQADF